VQAYTFTKGIWKSVYLVSVSMAAITHLVPLVTYSAATSAFPTQPLSDGNHAPFDVTGEDTMTSVVAFDISPPLRLHVALPPCAVNFSVCVGWFTLCSSSALVCTRCCEGNRVCHGEEPQRVHVQHHRVSCGLWTLVDVLMCDLPEMPPASPWCLLYCAPRCPFPGLPPPPHSHTPYSWQGNWTGAGASASADVTLPAGDSNVTLTLSASAGDISLWWPVGLGPQPLFDVTAQFTPLSAPGPVSTSRPIGFRFAVVVTGNDTDPAYVQANANVDGTDGMGMRIR
jgi:hypothetical protein